MIESVISNEICQSKDNHFKDIASTLIANKDKGS